MPAAFALPIEYDLAATFLFALTGAWAAIRRDYDFVGVFALAFTVGVGGGLIRDGVFIQQGAPAAMQDARYLWAVVAATATGIVTHRLADRFVRLIAVVDAVGLGAYAVVGAQKALAAGLSVPAAVLVGVINAVGGGLIRDVLVREEPLFFKPGQFYALAALAGAAMFVSLGYYSLVPVEAAAGYSIAAVFACRLLAIQFNWHTRPIARWWHRAPARDEDPGKP